MRPYRKFRCNIRSVQTFFESFYTKTSRTRTVLLNISPPQESPSALIQQFQDIYMFPAFHLQTLRNA